MNILSLLNSAPMYAICGGIIAFVAVVCAVFMVRAYRAGLAMGIDRVKLKRAITSSATFSLLPSVGILLGVIALSGSLGTPWPWLRLSVIGALHYETQVAQAAAEQVGMSSLSAAEMTPSGFATIALLMSVCIMWGMVLSIFFNKRYLGKLGGRVGSRLALSARHAAKDRRADGSGAAAQRCVYLAQLGQALLELCGALLRLRDTVVVTVSKLLFYSEIVFSVVCHYVCTSFLFWGKFGAWGEVLRRGMWGKNA